jgi:N-methylhydantoinase A
MANAIRTVTIGKGWDPRQFALVAYGGAGPLHASFLAEELRVAKVIIPASPSTFSARGMLSTDLRHDLVRPVLAPLASVNPDELEAHFEQLGSDAASALVEQGVQPAKIMLARSADIRYVGQEYFLNMPCSQRVDHMSLVNLLDEFHVAYEQRYGHANPDEATEIVNLRVASIGRVGETPPLRSTKSRTSPSPERMIRALFSGMWVETPLYRRNDLAARTALTGPAVILEEYCTTVVPPNFSLAVDERLNLILSRKEEQT